MPLLVPSTIAKPLESIDGSPGAVRSRRHVVITGTGRAGTTFLVELLTHLGLDTGYAIDTLADRKDPRARAGLEHDIRKDDSPYIVKSPSFCDYADEVLARKEIAIDHVFIPMRDLNAAAESRRFVKASAVAEWSIVQRILHTFYRRRVRGGLWHTQRASDQETVLADQLYKLVLALSATNIPVTLLRFPRIIKDRAYLQEKLAPMLAGVTADQFDAAFQAVVRPDLAHAFNANDC